MTEVKQFNPEQIIQSQIVDMPDAKEERGPYAPIIFQIANQADEMTVWGKGVKRRDLELRSFFPTEPMLASAVYSMAAKLSTVEWEIVGSNPTKPKPRNTINKVNNMLHQAGGIGWQRTMMKVLIDLYTQDNGAFIEIIRAEDSPTSPVIGIQHLDAGRCWRLGDPETPVMYSDRYGRFHKLKWYQVITLEEMPSPVESMFNVQYCAVTRVLRYAQLLRDISIYKREKISGKNPGAIHFMSGVTQQEIDDAMAWAEENNLNKQIVRYTSPYIIGTINPNAKLEHREILMASLPDQYNENDTFKWYITIIALGFGTDYQEFAPLASANLGSSSQSEILHMKARGKGPAAVLKLISEALNYQGVLPRNVEFKFRVEDSRGAKEESEAKFNRAKTVTLLMDSGVITAKEGIELLFLDGDVPEHVFESRLEEIETEKEEELRKPDPLTVQQVQGGMNTQGGEVGESGAVVDGDAGGKGLRTDDVRVGMIEELQQRGDIVITDNPIELTEEDLEEADGILSRFFRKLDARFGRE